MNHSEEHSSGAGRFAAAGGTMAVPTDDTEPRAEGPNSIIRIVLHGLQGPIKVGSQEFGAAAMTAFKDAFSDQQIAAVLTFVRQNKEWGHTAASVTPEKVKAIREKEAARAE